MTARQRRFSIRPAFAALAVGVLLLAVGCGNAKEKSSGTEGEFIKVGQATYQVQLTRLLNPNQRPDDDLLQGQPQLPSKQQYLAVFLRIDNDGKKSYLPPRDMKVIDTQGNEYLPLKATQSGFALDFKNPIPPGDSAPPPDSPAANGPDNGAMVLFRVSEVSATENLPLDLEVPVPGATPSRITLDV